jgi:hypothetical protein
MIEWFYQFELKFYWGNHAIYGTFYNPKVKADKFNFTKITMHKSSNNLLCQ